MIKNKKETVKNLLNQVLSIYSTWIEEKPEEMKARFQEIHLDFEDCINIDPDELSEKDLKDAINNKQQLMVKASIHYLGEIENRKWISVISNMNKILQIDASNIHAVYYLMIGNYQIGVYLLNLKNKKKPAKKHLKKAMTFSRQIISKYDDKDRINEAQTIQKEITKLLKN